jgi:hypothetical protein
MPNTCGMPQRGTAGHSAAALGRYRLAVSLLGNQHGRELSIAVAGSRDQGSLRIPWQPVDWRSRRDQHPGELTRAGHLTPGTGRGVVAQHRDVTEWARPGRVITPMLHPLPSQFWPPLEQRPQAVHVAGIQDPAPLDLRLQRNPTGKSVATSHGQLRGRETHRPGHGGERAHCRLISATRRAQQVFGLPTQLIKIRTSGQIRHDSFPSARRSASQAPGNVTHTRMRIAMEMDSVLPADPAAASNAVPRA